jgi:hypothetical protein
MDMAPEELPLQESIETEPGLVVERRCFLKTAALALGAVAIPGLATSKLGQTERSALTMDEFIAEVVPIAKALLEDPSLAGQDRYLLTIASHAVRLEAVPEPTFRESGQGTGPGVLIGSNGAPGPFVVLHWKMQPGTEIRRHAHTYGNVVTLGLEGEALVENFEVLGEPDYDTTEAFQVRRTVTQWLTPGATNLVNLQRNYIHGFKAGSLGARGLDITTRLLEKRQTPYLDLGDPVVNQPGVFQGSWTE